MLKASRILPSVSFYSYLRSPLINTICRYGSFDDVELVYQYFLQTKEEDLLQVLMTFGNEAMAEDLFHQAIDNGKLKRDFPPQTLFALSYLQHQQTLAVLIDYYQQVFELDWTFHEMVCQALLNYNCKGYESIIENGVAKCLDKVYYPDYAVLPLATTKNDDLLFRLIKHAENGASPACVGPLILTIALSGQQHKQLLLSNLYEDGWAVHPFEDNSRFILMGLNILNISIKEIYATACAALENDAPNAQHMMMLITQLLEANLHEPDNYFIHSIPKRNETFQSIYQAVFTSVYDADFLYNNPGKEETIYGYIKRYTANKDFEKPFAATFERLEELYLQKAVEEAVKQYRLTED